MLHCSQWKELSWLEAAGPDNGPRYLLEQRACRCTSAVPSLHFLRQPQTPEIIVPAERMPPKKRGEEKKAGPEDGEEDGAERELVEKELVIGYLKSKLGR